MKAIGYIQSLPPSDPKSLFDFELPKPTPLPNDLLVAVRAVSVNPVDTKIRMRAQGTEAQPKILGYDCAGIVESVGEELPEPYVTSTDLDQQITGLLADLTPAGQLLHLADGNGCVSEGQERLELWIADSIHVTSLE